MKMNSKAIWLSLRLLATCLVIGIGFQSCESDEEEDVNGDWVRVGYYKGQPRAGAVSFVINNNAFVGLGYNGRTYFSDFYYYNGSTGLWQNVAAFPGVARERAVAFVINNKAYVGLGYNRDLTNRELRDFYEYDPETDTWTQIADFASTARYNAVAFSINSKGYVGTGYDGTYYCNDLWQYNPESKQWLEVASFPGGKREDAVAVVIDSKAYFMGGRNNGAYSVELWVFDGNTEGWAELTPDDEEDYYDEFVNAVSRYNAVGFSINGRLYIGTGVGSSGSLDNSFYEFEPATGVWEAKTSFEGSVRSLCVAFVLENRGFIGTGQSSSYRYDDVWELLPEEDYDNSPTQ